MRPTPQPVTEATLPEPTIAYEPIHTAVKNAAWLMSDHLLRMVITLVVGAWVARHLGPEVFGELSYILAFVAFFQVFSTLGLDGVLVREIAGNRNIAPAALGSALAMRLVAGVVSWAGACLLMSIVRPHDVNALVLVATVAGGIVFQSADVIDLWFQSQSQSRRTVLAKTSAYILSNLARVLLILAGAGIKAFAVLLLAEAVLAACFLIVAYRRCSIHRRWQAELKVASALIKESWPLILSALMIATYSKIDQLMLKEMVGEHEVGIYAAAVPFSVAWAFFPAAVCVSILPMLSRLYIRSPDQFYLRMQQLFSLLTWTAILVFLALAACADILVEFVLGSAFSSSSEVLVIHSLGNIFSFMIMAQGQWVIIAKRRFFALFRNLLGALANVAVNWFLIPRYGAIGAAIGSVFAQMIAAMALNVASERNFLVMQVRSFLPGSLPFSLLQRKASSNTAK